MANHEAPRYVLRTNAGVRAPGTDLAQTASRQAGQDVWDERTTHLYQFGWRDVRHSGIIVPVKFAADERMAWAQHRSLLWNLAEYLETQKDARVARGYTTDLPASLTHAQRADLTRNFAQTLADRFGSAVDYSIHDAHTPHTSPHNHLLMTTRELTLEGFGRVTSDGTRREVGEISKLWLGHLTKALQAAYMEERSWRAQAESRGESNAAQPRAFNASNATAPDKLQQPGSSRKGAHSL